MAEEQLLREHASRREDAHRQLPLLPAAKRARHVREDVANQLTAPIAILPDPALQLFERRRLAITIHEPFGVGRDCREARGFRFVDPTRYSLAVQRIGSVLFAEPREDGL